MFQRSADVALGVPFNIASYSFFTHLLAKHCDLLAHEFIYYLGNAHIYESHLDAMNEQVTRTPIPFPKITVNTKRENINDYTVDDFELHDYKCHDAIKMKMVA
jgi:thymidylate synthase